MVVATGFWDWADKEPALAFFGFWIAVWAIVKVIKIIGGRD